MIDINLIRENPEFVKENIKKKFQDYKLALVDEVIALDIKKRELQQEGDNLRARLNTLAKQIGAFMKEGKREEAEKAKAESKTDNERIAEIDGEMIGVEAMLKKNMISVIIL